MDGGSTGINSIEVLSDAREALLVSSEFCGMFSASDIGECLYADIGDCKLILPEEELQELNDMAAFHISKLKSLFDEKDNKAAASVVGDMIDLLNGLPSKEEVEAINLEMAKDRHHSEGTVIVFGDSHSCFFSGNEMLNLVSIGYSINLCPDSGDKPFTALHLGPCLAYNACRYNTHNRFLEKSQWLMSNFFSRGEKLVVSLGEIDMRAHVYKETVKQCCDYRKVVNDITENYITFLRGLKEQGYKVFVWGPIASQKDYHPNDHNLLPRYGSERERNLASVYFSDVMRKWCSENEVEFMSVLGKMIDRDLFTEERYMCPDSWHLGQAAWDIANEEWTRAGLL